jgi:hypothetical protein
MFNILLNVHLQRIFDASFDLVTQHTAIHRRQPTKHPIPIIILWEIDHQFETLTLHGAVLAHRFRTIPTGFTERHIRKEHINWLT